MQVLKQMEELYGYLWKANDHTSLKEMFISYGFIVSELHIIKKEIASLSYDIYIYIDICIYLSR